MLPVTPLVLITLFAGLLTLLALALALLVLLLWVFVQLVRVCAGHGRRGSAP